MAADTYTNGTIAMNRRVREFLDRSPVQGVIDGQPAPSSSRATFKSFDPGSDRAIAEVADLIGEDVDSAVASGERAFRESGWATMENSARSALLHRFADLVEVELDVIAQLESLDAGKIYVQAQGDVQNFADTIRYFADLAQHADARVPLSVKGHDAWRVRLPWGVCAFIFPWNFPILLLGWGIAPALAAGNVVVVKPAEDTPLSTVYVAELALRAGIPPGVFNVIPGRGSTAGAALASHPRIKRMSFTGSPEVGRLVAEACARNLVPVKLELGGKGAAVVFEDVDVDKTAAKLAGAITFHAGQVCCDATRWIVHRPIYDRFVERCKANLQGVTIGHQLNVASQMGPVVSSKQRDRILGYLSKSQHDGAELVLAGGLLSNPANAGHFVKPALLAGSLDNVAAQEEIFGPVAFLAPFDDEHEAIAMANKTEYGLANSVWTANPQRACRVAEAMCAGNAWINAHNVFPHGVPYGGVGKSGLGGGVLSIETLLDYWRQMSVVRPLAN